MTYQEQTVFSAQDIARILVRNPDEIVDLPTYNRICEQYCHGRAIEDLSPDEKRLIFSLESGISDLLYLGFDEAQLEAFLDATYEAYRDIGIEIDADKIQVRTRAERIKLISFVAISFPYGPPLTKNDFNLAVLPTYTPNETNADLLRITSRLCAKLMEKRLDMPYLFSPVITKRPHTDSVFDFVYDCE